MTDSAPPPIFTFRGHKVGVTALVHHSPSTLYSGDEEGNIISWDLTTFKKLATWPSVCRSKILSLKIVVIATASNPKTEILIVQSRNDGVHLNKLDNFENLKSFPTYQSLFSRGDAITESKQSQAILAYPSEIESHLVTVRYLGQDAVTLFSGSAQRQDADKKRRESSVFDIQIRTRDSNEYFLFVAYEDGQIVKYSFDQSRLESVPELNVTGLKIVILQKFDLGITDFVSAFDVIEQDFDRYVIWSGSPKRELAILFDADLPGERRIEIVTMKKPGISSIAIRSDQKFVAVASWDNNIRLFSIKSHRHLATLKNHLKQVSAIVFAPKNIGEQQKLMCCSSLDGTISIFDIY